LRAFFFAFGGLAGWAGEGACRECAVFPGPEQGKIAAAPTKKYRKRLDNRN